MQLLLNEGNSNLKKNIKRLHTLQSKEVKGITLPREKTLVTTWLRKITSEEHIFFFF